MVSSSSLIHAFNEWDPLEEVIVGIADHSMFPDEDPRMMKATMPPDYLDQFRSNNPFPKDIVENARKELDHFSKMLESFGVVVRRPDVVDWSNPKTKGYTASMVRDALLPAGNKLVEAPMSWKCRNNEHLAYETLLKLYGSAPGCKVIRRPPHSSSENLIDGGDHAKGYVINDNRPAFDAAGKYFNTMIGQLSNVTNPSGIQLLRDCLKGTGIELHVLDVTDSHAMHIDATTMPLREGLMIYHPDRITVKKLREVPALKDWTFIKRPEAQARDYPPLYMTGNTLNMNVLSLDGHRVFIESSDDHMAELLLEHGMVPLRVPFKNVNCLGGSFHCSTVDVRRSPKSQLQTDITSATPVSNMFTGLVNDVLCGCGDKGIKLEDEDDTSREKSG